MLYPLTFKPLFKERVWGGRKLEQLFHKPLPPGRPIGESWEIADRPGDVSVIANGPCAGKDLHWLTLNHTGELFGVGARVPERFPVLVKILDAREKLSLQVHPPAQKAVELGGEPKTELWYITEADPNAELYVGLKRGVSRASFEQKVKNGTVAECFHRVAVKRGDAMFLPSGRVHAIGAGLVNFEIQQNSDTTYRVFDWNRVGLDGKPRPLHVIESLASIDFEDFEPGLLEPAEHQLGPLQTGLLVDHELFRIDRIAATARAVLPLGSGTPKVVGVVHGAVAVPSQLSPVELRAGQFCLLPASVGAQLVLEPATTLLLVESRA